MITIGAQGYTLRQYMQTESDIARSLARVAAIGYKAIQISAIGKIAPEKLKALCDENGLQIVLTHSAEARILHDTDALIAEHKLFGCKYIGIGSMPDRYRNPEWTRYFAEDFLPAARRIADAGLRLMYHNHNFEFARMPDGRFMMEHILEGLPEDVMGVTADTYWLQAGGVDVRDWLQSHAGRIQCVHLKDMAIVGWEQRMAAVGTGSLDFPAILRTLEDAGTVEYALVEQDECYGQSPFDCLKKSYDYLVSLGYK